MGLLDYFNRGASALTGTTGNYGGLLGEDEQKAANQAAQMALAAQLLDAGGYSNQRVGLGQALGRGIGAANQARQGSVDQSLQAALLRKQLASASAKDNPFGNINPKDFTADSVKAFEVSGKYSDLVPVTKVGDNVGAYQPGDYTDESWSKFAAGGFKDPALLKRYVSPRQEYSPSFQNVTRNLPDGSTQQGTFNTRTGEYDWVGAVVAPGKKSEVDAAGRERGKITGAREGKAPVAYNTFKTGMASLEKAMDNTITNPIAGRFPAVTAAQQTAEGSESAMAPVLKQLFRDSGEGSFTDADQELLMKMVPTRKDHPEARKAKIEMIDSIVQAKLGMTTGEAPAAASTAAPKRVKVDASGKVIQ